MKRATGLSLLLLLPLIGGCDMVVMNPTGDIAYQQRNLILFSVGVMLLIIVPVMVLTVLFAYRYRRGNPNKVYDPTFHHSTTLELVIWSGPLLIIIALSAVTWTSTHLLDPFRPLERLAPGVPVPPDAKPLNVQVVALDWKWLFIYPDLGIATVNELALPVNVPVRFSITSTDQFNTFYAPTLAGMIYAMPTMRSELNAVLNKPGESWGYSGNYTGRGYSNMRFKLHGVEPADFDRWVADVKVARGGLDLPTLIELVKPSEKVPVMHFASVQDGVFDRAVNRCIDPAKPCRIEALCLPVPPDHGAQPLTGREPTPASDKAPDAKGPSANATPPVEPADPRKPDDTQNHDLP